MDTIIVSRVSFAERGEPSQTRTDCESRQTRSPPAPLGLVTAPSCMYVLEQLRGRVKAFRQTSGVLCLFPESIVSISEDLRVSRPKWWRIADTHPHQLFLSLWLSVSSRSHASRVSLSNALAPTTAWDAGRFRGRRLDGGCICPIGAYNLPATFIGRPSGSCMAPGSTSAVF